jgi:hypothetical protein
MQQRVAQLHQLVEPPLDRDETLVGDPPEAGDRGQRPLLQHLHGAATADTPPPFAPSRPTWPLLQSGSDRHGFRGASGEREDKAVARQWLGWSGCQHEKARGQHRHRRSIACTPEVPPLITLPTFSSPTNTDQPDHAADHAPRRTTVCACLLLDALVALTNPRYPEQRQLTRASARHAAGLQDVPSRYPLALTEKGRTLKAATE